MFGRRSKWLPEFTLQTASQTVATILAVALLASFGQSRGAVADSMRWLAHPVRTPRVVFLLVLGLAALGGGIILAALARRLSGRRRPLDTPKTRAERFRSDFEALADNLRRWMPRDIAHEDPMLQEIYRDLRREVSTSYAPVRDEFNRFIEENPDWDLRPPPSEMEQVLGLFPDTDDPPDGPFTDLWQGRALPEALAWVRKIGHEEFPNWIATRSDVLDAFVRSMPDP